MHAKFNGGLLYQEKYNAKIGGLILSIYTVYSLSPRTINFSFVLKNCLFGAVEITKKADVDKYKYSEYGIGFDTKGSFTHPDGGCGRNVIIFGADLSNSKHPNNKTRNILVLGRDFIQKIDGTTIYAEKMYSPNFTVENKTFCSSLQFNGDDSYLFVNGKQVINFKAKDSEIKAYQLCLGNISKGFSASDWEDTGLYGKV